MNILHLTDFHYSNEQKYLATQERLVDSLIKSIKKNDKVIDFVFFTGDLVYSGKNKNDFFAAKDLIITKVCKELDINESCFIICPGNHDVYRGQEIDGIGKIIDEISDNEKLDEFVIKQEKKSLIASLENLNHYFEFQKDFVHPNLEFRYLHSKSKDPNLILIDLHQKHIVGSQIV